MCNNILFVIKRRNAASESHSTFGFTRDMKDGGLGTSPVLIEAHRDTIGALSIRFTGCKMKNPNFYLNHFCSVSRGTSPVIITAVVVDSKSKEDNHKRM